MCHTSLHSKHDTCGNCIDSNFDSKNCYLFIFAQTFAWTATRVKLYSQQFRSIFIYLFFHKHFFNQWHIQNCITSKFDDQRNFTPSHDSLFRKHINTERVFSRSVLTRWLNGKRPRESSFVRIHTRTSRSLIWRSF